MSARLPMIRLHCSFGLSMWPKLAWVDSRDASVISRLPFRPNKAGTNMNTSDTTRNTSQCCKHQVHHCMSLHHTSLTNTSCLWQNYTNDCLYSNFYFYCSTFHDFNQAQMAVRHIQSQLLWCTSSTPRFLILENIHFFFPVSKLCIVN